MKLLDLAVPWWLKLVGLGVVASCLLWIFLVLKGWHDDSQALPGVKQELTASRAETKQVRLDLIAEAGRLAAVNKGLSDENAELKRVRDAVPVRTVRLCRPAGEAGQGPGHPAAPGGSDASAATPGVLPPEAGRDLEAGPDIGPRIYALADEMDEQTRLYRGAQAYIRGLPAACAASGYQQ